MNKYSIDHTGAKTQFGGFQDGFTIEGYQVTTFEVVVRAPMAEAAKAMAINRLRASQRFTLKVK
jgi:hypothetical protein